MDLWFILANLCLPVIGALALALALPYITARSIVPAFGKVYISSSYVSAFTITIFGTKKTFMLMPYHPLTMRLEQICFGLSMLMDNIGITLCSQCKFWLQMTLFHMPSSITLAPLIPGVSFEMENMVLRRIYPSLLAIILLIGFCIFQARQFRRLYEHIKNDKWVLELDCNEFVQQGCTVKSLI